jgi:hypothetical protein
VEGREGTKALTTRHLVSNLSILSLHQLTTESMSAEVSLKNEPSSTDEVPDLGGNSLSKKV